MSTIGPAYVFATAPIPSQPGRQPAGVPPPESTEEGTLHVFAITAG